MLERHNDRRAHTINLDDGEVRFGRRALRNINDQPLEQILAMQFTQQLIGLGMIHIDNPKVDETITHTSGQNPLFPHLRVSGNSRASM